MPETDANTDCLNYRRTVWTVNVMRQGPCTSFWVAIFTVIPVAPFRDHRTSGDDTLVERYERTMNRIEQIAGAGYKVKIQWECEFDDAKILDEKLELLTHPIVQHSPLKTRDALYGGRIETMHLHYKICENETIDYCDVISLSVHL